MYMSKPYLAKFQSVTRSFVHLIDFLMFLLQCLGERRTLSRCHTVSSLVRKTAPQQGATSLVSFIALCFITQFSRLLANKPCIMLDISGYLYPGWIKHPLCGSRPALLILSDGLTRVDKSGQNTSKYTGHKHQWQIAELIMLMPLIALCSSLNIYSLNTDFQLEKSVL